jgi:Ni/Co efflux regulator RcnB
MKKIVFGLMGLIALMASGAVRAQDRSHHGGERGGFERGVGPGGGPGYGYNRGGYGPEGGRPDFGGRGYGRPDFGGPGGGPGYGGGYPGPRASFAGPPGRGVGPRGFTRGQFLPPSYLGGAVADPRLYHLRRPPNGYGWVTVGPNAYLTQRSTGLILDTAPLY